MIGSAESSRLTQGASLYLSTAEFELLKRSTPVSS